mmetsp:Transcript_13563/g.15211  ORF Transcript_13563/g.15211 Transcript_13563/m.15211 type:complete len:114 (-) Transcript_13563:160-501(-)|eukprot:CAMPEP_0205827604 /NCGR_PEP_ID=MMETSP0206-20130828/32592_1 /ASSEMBLY_ACC=CAM_ASM_000279 /TAXON_ID=36767 /ORGANISM="Euplotes focardii, Strain TN1" /LENGTH=113 /DNA_ID=CAMNT_0053128681 /DNA_START=32 /DNA_END=373 /DNA_ORIENTATION=+
MAEAAHVFTISLQKPLGIQVGPCSWGTFVGSIDEEGNAADWNAQCAEDVFDAERKIEVGDMLVAIATEGGKMVSMSGRQHPEIMDFFLHKSGDPVTLQLQRMTPAQKTEAFAQ